MLTTRKSLLAELERSRIKRRLKQAFARKPKPARVRPQDERAAHQPTKEAEKP